MVLTIGSHMNRKSETYSSIVDALKGEKSIGGNIMQIFLGSSIKSTLTDKFKLTAEDIKQIKRTMKSTKVKIVVHGVLTLNFCSPITKRYEWNITNLVYDLELNQKMGGLGVVIHMGTRKTKNFDITYEEAEKNYIKNLVETIKRTKDIKSRIILETSCNQPNKVGGTLEQFARLYKKVPKRYKDRVGTCVDTAHVFAAGYQIHTLEGMKDYWDKFDKLIGIKNCTLIHLNDSQKECCSCIDRHETIGKGFIFSGSTNSLQYIVQLAKKHSIPIILETKAEFFKKEIALIKKLATKSQKGGEPTKDLKPLILDIFQQMYDFHTTLGNNGNNKTPFRAMGYRRAINGLKAHKGAIHSSQDAKGIPGIGKGFLEKIDEIVETKKLKVLEELKSNKKLVAKQEFQNILGIGPKLASKLVTNYKLHSIKDLRDAVKSGKVELSPLQLQGLKYQKDLSQKIPRKEVEKFGKIIASINENIYKPKKSAHSMLAGSYRLGKKESGDVDVIIYNDMYKDKHKFMEDFVKAMGKMVVYVVSWGKQKIMLLVKLPGGKVRHMDLMFIERRELPWYLLYFGSDVTFARRIRQYAAKKGYKLNEFGLFDRKTGKRIKFEPKSERDIFKFLGLVYIEPKDRLTIRNLN